MKKFISSIKTFLLYFFAIWLFIGIIIYLSTCIAYPEVRIPLIVMIVIFSFLEIICITKIVKHRKSKKNNGTFEEKDNNALATAYNYLSNAAFSTKSEESISNESTTSQDITKPASHQFEVKTKQQQANQNTISSQNFFAMQLENEIRIMNDSYELASKTFNLTTFKMRFDLYLEKANLILSRTNNPQTIQRCKSLIADQGRLKARIVDYLSKKAIEEAKKQKTPQEIITRLESAYNELQNATFLHDAPYYEEMIALLKKTIDDIKSAAYTQPKEGSPYSRFKPDSNKSIDEISEDARKHSEAKEPQQYIIHKNTIEKVGGEITKDDVPYLIALSYQDVLKQEANSINPKFHRTDREEELAFNFFQKYEEQISRLECSFEYPYREEQKTYNYQDKITLLELALNNFDKAKKWCYSKGKGGQIHFDDMWMNLHNSQTECFSYATQIQHRLDFIKTLMVIRQQILDIVNQTPEILQKDIYKFFDEEQKSDVVYAIKDLVKDDCILKEKKGNSYSLTALVSQDVRNRN